MKINPVRALVIGAAVIACLGCDSPATIARANAAYAAEIAGIEAKVSEAIAKGYYVLVFRTNAYAMSGAYFDNNNMERSFDNNRAIYYFCSEQPVCQQRASLRVIWGDMYMQYLPNGEFTHTIEVYYNGRLVDRQGKVGVAESYTAVTLWGK